MQIAPLSDNPFTALTLIAAPAVLTNASSVLALGTSNRFARAIDRARALSTQIEQPRPVAEEWRELRMRQLSRVQRRCVLLLNALTLFYLALGSFGCASLVSLLGAVFSATSSHLLFRISVIVALVAGVIGVGSLVAGCSLLVVETRFAVANIFEETAMIRKKYGEFVENTDR